MIIVRLAGPPRGKGRGRAVATPMGARVFTDDKTRKYEAQLRFAAQQVMAGAAPLDGPLSVIVRASFPIAQSWPKRKRAAALAGALFPCTTPDADNLLKCLDGCNGIIWIDDKQIVEATIYKIYSEAPGLTVMVSPMRLPDATAEISP